MAVRREVGVDCYFLLGVGVVVVGGLEGRMQDVAYCGGHDILEIRLRGLNIENCSSCHMLLCFASQYS